MTGWRIKRTDWAIIATIIANLLIPLSYYAWGDSPGDARYAWRMFSRSDTVQCGGAFLGASGEPLPLPTGLGPMWREKMDDGVLPVVRSVGRLLCETHPGPIVVELKCRDIENVGWQHRETLCE
ncbi:MAG: hypothetical protein ACI9OJ_001124 [Myxococcota bacterium]|jgi:hypothetical protein